MESRIWDTGGLCYSVPPAGVVRGRCGCPFGRTIFSCQLLAETAKLFVSLSLSLAFFQAVLSLSERMLQAVALIKSSCVGQMSQAQWNARNAEAQRERGRERVCLGKGVQTPNSNQCSSFSAVEACFRLRVKQKQLVHSLNNYLKG